MAPRAGHARVTTRGFILAATLWALAALAVLAAYIDRAVAAETARAQADWRLLQDELDARSTEATLLYLMATQRSSNRGLDLAAAAAQDGGELRYTGVAYAGLGRTRFAVFDEGSLASVNTPRSGILPNVLRSVGVSPLNVRRLVPRIADYVDLDSEQRLNGAERFDYARRRLPLPADWPMVSPLELRRVQGMDEVLSETQWRTLRPLLTARYPFAYNFNTMHPEVIAALLEVDRQSLNALLAARDARPLTSLHEVAQLSGVYPEIDPLLLAWHPSPSLKIATWRPGGGQRSVLGILITPGAEFAPWRKEYRYSEPIVDASAAPRKAPTALFQPS
jgi:general secretion pathway protein K